jgi:putative ABC transport system permease protein
MKGSDTPRLIRYGLGLLRHLSPPGLRDRWVKEWEGELTHWWRRKSASHPAAHLHLLWRFQIAARDAIHLRTLGGSWNLSHPKSAIDRQTKPSRFPAILQDVRFGLRTSRKAPWLSSVTILTLALGIGASVAMFGVLDAVFLRPLPFPDADRLVVGRATVQGRLNPWVAGADYYDYRAESDAFEDMAAILPFPQEMTLSGRGEADRVSGNLVSPSLFPTLRVTPAKGRRFQPRDGLPGAEDVVLLSHGFWQQRLGGDPEILGTTLTLDGDPFTVVGVLRPDFFFLVPADFWLPMRPDRYAASSRGNHNWYVVGRLKDGIGLEQAQANVGVVSARLQEAYPETNTDKALLLTSLRQVLTEDYQLSLWLLSGAVALVLLIACGNGAGILLARAPTRQFELSVRAAMGAPRHRLVRQLLAESLGLSLAGGGVGILLAVWFQRVLLEYLSMERLGLEDPGISFPTLAAALAASLLAGLLAGLYPALRGSNVSPGDGLKSGSRGGEDGGTGFRSGLVAAQVAISVILLAASGLLVKSLSNLQALDPGFHSSGVLTAEVQIPTTRYSDASARTLFYSALLEELRALPGVQSAAVTSHLPIGDFGNIYRANAQGSGRDPERIFLRSVFPGYFETLEIPLLSGRDVDLEDQEGSPWVVILSETAAERLFPEDDPVGKVVELPFPPNPRPAEVVGVVGDVRLSRLEEEPEAAVYVPYPHHARTEVRFALRTQLPASTFAETAREAVRRMDPEVPLSRTATLESLVADSMAERRILTLSLTLLALLPLVLASVGLFGILAYHVSRRRHEMGVRMALGADATHVGGLVLRQGLSVVAAGVLLGLGGAMAGTRMLRGMLFGVEALDPFTFLGTAGLVLGVGLIACAIPVWRAVRADPKVALQAE